MGMKLSRRNFLILSGAGAVGLILDQLFPGLRRASAEAETLETVLGKEIRTYADSMGFSAEAVASRVERRYLVDMSDQQFGAIVDPDSSMPLLVTNENHEWQPAYLKEIGRHGDIQVGQLVESQIDLRILHSDFNKGLLSSSWNGNFNTDYSYNPDADEAGYRFGHIAGIEDYRFMHLIYPHSQNLPDWLRDGIRAGTMSAGEIQTVIENYVTAVMTRFKGRIKEYVVVNEAYRNQEQDELLRIGLPDYIEVAFRAARRADPGAVLVLNGQNNHFKAGQHTQTDMDIARRLSDQGLLDKVGLQMHIYLPTPGLDYDSRDVADTIRRYRDVGLSVAITEFDVNIKDYITEDFGRAQSEEERRAVELARFHKQAEVSRNLIGASLSAGVTDIGFWGDQDHTSWQNKPEYMGNKASTLSQPCMWDEDRKPKPAYYAVRKVLFAHVATDITKRTGAQRR
jgi:endo-1,4-beta-xylanase